MANFNGGKIFPALIGLFLLWSVQAHAQATQCVASAFAGGTVNALTIPLLPCGLSTNLLTLTIAGTNTAANPTLQMAGFPAQPIQTSSGGALDIGALPAAGSIMLMSSTGTSWRILSQTSANGGDISGDTVIATGGSVARTMAAYENDVINVKDFASIQAGIDYLYSVGGGTLWFPANYSSVITTPLILKNGVHLRGSCTIQEVPPLKCSRLEAGANMAAMITQASLGDQLKSVGIEQMVLDGKVGTYTITSIINIAALNSYIQRNYIVNGSGDCLHWTDNGSAAWINWITENTIGGCTTAGIYFDGSDSRILANYISGNGIGIDTACTPLIENNQVELNTSYGIRVRNCLLAPNNSSLNSITGNFFTQNTTADIYLTNGSSSTNCVNTISGNLFHASNGDNILIQSACKGGIISGNVFNDTNAIGAYSINWGSTTTNTGWTVGPNAFSDTTATRYNNLPIDVVLLGSSGVGGGLGTAGGTATVMQGTTIIGSTSSTVADTLLNVFGSTTTRSQANTAVRVGVARNSAAVDAALLFGVESGNGPFIAAADGETTNVGQFNIKYRGSNTVTIDGSTITGSLPYQSTRFVSTVATGTAPLTVASTTNVANLNASSLNGATFAAPGNIGSGTPATGLTVAGHIVTGGSAPAPTSCGMTPAIAGSDSAGEITMGTGSPTGCIVTFAFAYVSAPFCTVTWQDTPLASQSYTISNTAITLVQTATSSNKVNYVCVARAGG